MSHMTCRTISITESIEVCDSYPLLELTYNFNFTREGDEKVKPGQENWSTAV
jgi:hypothetical protein